MNRLSREHRSRILQLLVEGNSLRSTSRITKNDINTIMRLLVDAGNVCGAYHDEHVRNIVGHRFIECDEIWSFTYAKQKNVAGAKAAPKDAGHTWTWVALDSDLKLIISYLISGARDVDTARIFMKDLRSRLQNRPQISTDGLRAYKEAVEEAFGEEVDFAQIVKSFEKDPEKEKLRVDSSAPPTVEKTRIKGHPDMGRIGTSFVERHNLTMRMGMRRYTRYTNAFSKKIENHWAMVNLYAVYYNFCRLHHSLHVTPAMMAGLAVEPYPIEWIVERIEKATPPPRRPGPKPGTKYKKRKATTKRAKLVRVPYPTEK